MLLALGTLFENHFPKTLESFLFMSLCGGWRVGAKAGGRSCGDIQRMEIFIKTVSLSHYTKPAVF